MPLRLRYSSPLVLSSTLYIFCLGDTRLTSEAIIVPSHVPIAHEDISTMYVRNNIALKYPFHILTRYVISRIRIPTSHSGGNRQILVHIEERCSSRYLSKAGHVSVSMVVGWLG